MDTLFLFGYTLVDALCKKTVTVFVQLLARSHLQSGHISAYKSGDSTGTVYVLSSV